MTTHLGQAIRELRREAGMSQTELASALGIARNSLARYERGERVPELYTFFRLCELNYGLPSAARRDMAEMDGDA